MSLEDYKKAAAIKAVNEISLKDDMVIGIGSGSTIVYAVKQLADRITNQHLKNVICIPSSFQAKQLILQHGLKLGSLDVYDKVIWTIDGADEVTPSNVIIKGGGGCLTQEKILASCSENFYVIADYTKWSENLGDNWKNGIPIEVIPLGFVPIKRKIEEQFGGIAEIRLGLRKAGPVVTDNSNFILDWKFPNEIKDWKVVEKTIKLMPGVVEIGLFIQMASKVYIAGKENEVIVKTLKNV